MKIKLILLFLLLQVWCVSAQKEYSKPIQKKDSIAKELEKQIQQQVALIQSLDAQINASAKTIAEQKNILNEQDKQIHSRADTIQHQLNSIQNQKYISLVLVSLLIALVICSFFWYYNYWQKNKLKKQLLELKAKSDEQSIVLASKDKELEQFAYITSHDLQEPLNTISSFVQLLSDEYLDTFDEMGKESLQFIGSASKRMKKLIDALLQYSRLGSYDKSAYVDLNTLIEDIEVDLYHMIRDKEVKIHVESLPLVKGARIELKLLLQNLLSNAIKFAKPDIIPLIRIGYKEKKDTHSGTTCWEFSVQDNGIGIPAIHKERIFSIFQRLHVREQYDGTGIGLAYCKKIVEDHGGNIWLNSTEDVGTTFYFTLPI